MKNNKSIYERHKDLFDNLSDYALIKNNTSATGQEYGIFFKPTQGDVLIEYEHKKVVELMIKKGCEVFDDINDVLDPNFIPKQLIWDDNKKKWVSVNV